MTAAVAAARSTARASTRPGSIASTGASSPPSSSSYGGGPVGLEAIAATINDEAETLAEVVEPFLLKIGYIVRRPTGRRATAAAYAHLGHARRRAGRSGGATVVIPLGKILLRFGLVMVLLGVVLLLAGTSRKGAMARTTPRRHPHRARELDFYFPLATSLIISVVLTLLLSLFGRR